MIIQLLIAIFCLYVTSVEAEYKNASIAMSDRNADIIKNYIKMDKLLTQFVDRSVRRALPFFLQATENLNISSTCMDNSMQLMNGLRKLTEWAVNFLDSSGKPQSGIVSGNVQMFGEPNQCLETVVKKKDKISFRGKYCSVIVKPFIPDIDFNFDDIDNLIQNSSGFLKLLSERAPLFFLINPRLGICVPSGCSTDDVSEFFRYISENYFVNATVFFCINEEDVAYWNPRNFTLWSVFGFLLIIVLISTTLDNVLESWKTNQIGTASRILQCFSASRNFPKLISTKISEGSVTSFNGIRVLSVFWIILCHEYVLQGIALMSNHSLDVVPFMRSFFGQIVMNGFTATEVFFFIGGFVNCYTRVNIHKRGKSQPNFLQVMIHRLWRIFPNVIAAMMVHFVSINVVPQSYRAKEVGEEICINNWWKNFLFINNFYPVYEQCIPHTWYLSVDMQMFLISVITIPLLLRNEKLGMYLHIGIIFVSSIACFILFWVKNLPPGPTIVPTGGIQHLTASYAEYNLMIYMLPYIHISSYYIGILFGYLAATRKKRQFSTAYYVLGWLAASFFYLFTMFVTYRWNSGIPYSKLESSLYGSLSKPVITLCIAWMVYCCISGQARIVNYVLSLKIWIPLSRLTFMLYLISIILQSYYYANLHFPPDFVAMSLIWSYFGNLSISLLLCLALVLLIESPTVALEKILFRRKQDNQKSPSEIPKEITLNGKMESGLKENRKVTSEHL